VVWRQGGRRSRLPDRPRIPEEVGPSPRLDLYRLHAAAALPRNGPDSWDRDARRRSHGATSDLWSAPGARGARTARPGDVGRDRNETLPNVRCPGGPSLLSSIQETIALIPVKRGGPPESVTCEQPLRSSVAPGDRSLARRRHSLLRYHGARADGRRGRVRRADVRALRMLWAALQRADPAPP